MKKSDIVSVTAPPEREAAFAIRKAVFVDEQNIPLPLEFDGRDEDAQHLLARLDGRAVGTLRLRTIDPTSAKIERVAVLADARGQAVGAALLRAALDHLLERGVREAKLHAQTHALGFYAKLGFEAFGEIFDEDGLPHRAMRKGLTSEIPSVHGCER